MAATRRVTDVSRNPEVVRWLWYVAAYLLLVVGLALLAQVVSAPPTS